MKIIIKNQSPFDDTFIKWLVNQLKQNLFSEVNIDLLDALNEKLYLIGIDIDLQKAFVQIVNNITYSKNKMYFHIFIRPNRRIRGTTYNCIEVAQLINYGTIEILGYGIFSKAFNELVNNLDYYLNKHSLGIG